MTRAAALLFLAIPALAEADIRMYDQGGYASGTSSLEMRSTYYVPDPCFRFYWRVSIPYTHMQWGGFEQSLSGAPEIEFTVAPDTYTDQYYTQFMVRWYTWRDLPSGYLGIRYRVSWSSTMEFDGRVAWENAGETHAGTYWVVDRANSCTACLATDREALLQDVGLDDHLCGTWAGVDLATGFGGGYSDSCRIRAYAVTSITRGWCIPTGQPTGILLPGDMKFAGVTGFVSGSGGTHSCVMIWVDDEQEWHLIEPSVCSTGQSPQMFIWGDEADESWTVPATYQVTEGDSVYLISSTIPSHTSTVSWDFVCRVSYREAPTYASGLSAVIASQTFRDLWKTAMAFDDAPNCDSHSMVEVPEGVTTDWGATIRPNPVIRFAEFYGGSESSSVRIYDARGRRVGGGVGGVVRWNADVAPGIYFARFSDGKREEVRKFTVVH